MKLLGTVQACAWALLLGACSGIHPQPIVHQPMSARPAAMVAHPAEDGAIYHSGAAYRPLFEDVRARQVGDVITIVLNENTAASKNADTSAAHNGSMNFQVPRILGFPAKVFQGDIVNGTSATTFEGKGASTANNNFTGTITVTVTEVLVNGNLLVSGEKQIAINQGEEFIRFSGVVNPALVASGNTVSSTQVADARIEYKGKGYIDEAQTMPWLSRFFMSIAPF